MPNAKKKKTPKTPQQEIATLKKQLNLLHDELAVHKQIISEIAHFTGTQKYIVRQGWETVDPNDPRYGKRGKTK